MSPEGNENSQGRSGGRNSQQQGPAAEGGQRPVSSTHLGQRQGELREAAAKPDRPLPHRRREPA